MAAFAGITVAMEQAWQEIVEFTSGANNDFSDFMVDTRTLTRQTAPKASNMTIPVKKLGRAVQYNGTYSGTGTTHDVESFSYDYDINNTDKYDPRKYGDVCENEQTVLEDTAKMYIEGSNNFIPRMCIAKACEGAGRKVVKNTSTLTPSTAYQVFSEALSLAVNTNPNVKNDYSTKAVDMVCFMSDRFQALLREANKANGLIITGATPVVENNNIVSLDGVEIRVQDNGIMYDKYEFDSTSKEFVVANDAKEVDLLFIPRNKPGNIKFLWDMQYNKLINREGVDGDFILRGYRTAYGAKVINMNKANVITVSRGDADSVTNVDATAATGRTVTANRKAALVE